jgi:hypothetical protein
VDNDLVSVFVGSVRLHRQNRLSLTRLGVAPDNVLVNVDDPPHQHFQARRLLLIREFGSFAVFLLVNFFFMPCIRAQKLFFLGPPSGCGALRLPPVCLL